MVDARFINDLQNLLIINTSRGKNIVTADPLPLCEARY
jgi:hypothetical protein